MTEEKEIPKLFIRDVAERVGCCKATIVNYEKKGLIKPIRDKNGFRRFTESQAVRLLEALNLQSPA
jgi:DNA-binding transcriptional MerR regulator